MCKQIEVEEDETIYDINGEPLGIIKEDCFKNECIKMEPGKDLYPSECLALVKYFVKEYWSNPEWKDFRDEVKEELFMVLEKEGNNNENP